MLHRFRYYSRKLTGYSPPSETAVPFFDVCYVLLIGVIFLTTRLCISILNYFFWYGTLNQVLFNFTSFLVLVANILTVRTKIFSLKGSGMMFMIHFFIYSYIRSPGYLRMGLSNIQMIPGLTSIVVDMKGGIVMIIIVSVAYVYEFQNAIRASTPPLILEQDFELFTGCLATSVFWMGVINILFQERNDYFTGLFFIFILISKLN